MDLLHKKRAASAGSQLLFSAGTIASNTTIGASPIRRTTAATMKSSAATTLVMPNHDHFTVSPMATANPNPMMMRDTSSVLLVSPSNSLGSASSSNGSFSHRTTGKYSNHPNTKKNKKKQQQHYPRNGHRQPMSPTNELRLQLLQRMAEYRAKGWINPAEERKYIQQLSSHHPNVATDPMDTTARRLQQEMDHIAEMYARQKATTTKLENLHFIPANHSSSASHSTNRINHMAVATPLLPPSSAAVRSPPPALKKKKPHATSSSTANLPVRRVSFAPTTPATTTTVHETTTSHNRTKTTTTTATKKSHKALISPNYNLPEHRSIPETEPVVEQLPAVTTTAEVEEPISHSEPPLEPAGPSILEPRVLWNQLQEQMQDDPDGDTLSISNESIVQNMFVEMCFFARLGFVQPPCCLYCAYRESVLQESPPRLDCERWVVWRKNAVTLLHPHRLLGNLLAVQCKTARLLSDGVTIDAHSWDVQRKQLVLHM